MGIDHREKEIRIVFLEDVPADQELAERELRKQGLSFRSSRAENEKELRNALDKHDPDLIISDYSLPGYDGMRALRLVREELGLSLPFIILTGALNEETAVECMKAGASDYVIKEHIKRLPFAVTEALRKDGIMKARQEAEKALRENEERLRLALQAARLGLFDLDLRTGNAYTTDHYAALLGQRPEDFQESLSLWSARLHPDEQDTVMRKFKDYLAGSRKEYFAEFRQRKPSGDWVWVCSHGEILEWDPDGSPVRLLGITMDVTERKIHERKLKESLEEKDVLLRELYHRTRNNMQVIAGLLSLQAVQTADTAVQDLCKKTESRIMVMARVHQRLYESKNLSSIGLSDYVRDVFGIIASRFPAAGPRTECDFLIDAARINFDTAIPLGLVLYEVFSDMIQHAFPAGHQGRIRVEGRRGETGELSLGISDNGNGTSRNFGSFSGETFGARLVQGIVEHQLRGKVTVSRENGLSFSITLPDCRQNTGI